MITARRPRRQARRRSIRRQLTFEFEQPRLCDSAAVQLRAFEAKVATPPVEQPGPERLGDILARLLANLR